MEDIVVLIQSVGFPAFVAVWFMLRDKRTLDVIEANTRAMQSLSDRVGNCPYNRGERP